MCAVSREGEQDANRFDHGSETQLYLAPEAAAFELMLTFSDRRS